MNCPICNVVCGVTLSNSLQRVHACVEHGVMQIANIYTDAYMRVVYPDLELVDGQYLPRDRAKGDVKKKLDKTQMTYLNCGCDGKQAKFLASLQDLRYVILECSLCHVKLRIRRESSNTSIAVDADGKEIGRLVFQPKP